MFQYRFIILCLIIVTCLATLYYFFTYGSFIDNIDDINPEDIPVVIISWNNLHFLRSFIEQLKPYKNPIIVLDNMSDYPPLLQYYKDVEEDLGARIDIRMLDKNYGHTVYQTLADQLPNVFILSDPDIRFNTNMPYNFPESLLRISEKYQAYKVGTALDISDSDRFVSCDNYTLGKNIIEWESQFWESPINDPDYELYLADVDTTTCLVNNKYKKGDKRIRVAGIFTAKHLPWYKDYIKHNIPIEEINHWKRNNKSSSILMTCLKI